MFLGEKFLGVLITFVRNLSSSYSPVVPPSFVCFSFSVNDDFFRGVKNYKTMQDMRIFGRFPFEAQNTSCTNTRDHEACENTKDACDLTRILEDSSKTHEFIAYVGDKERTTKSRAKVYRVKA